MVVALADDPHVSPAMQGLGNAHCDVKSIVRSVSLERLAKEARSELSLQGWADAFVERYLDCSHIIDAEFGGV